MAVSMSILGKRLKAARKACGFTQEYVAEQIDFSVPHFSKIECGRKNITVTKLCELCDLLNVPVEQILGGASTPQNAAYNRQFGEIAGACSPEAVETMLDVCEKIARLDAAAKRPLP